MAWPIVTGCPAAEVECMETVTAASVVARTAGMLKHNAPRLSPREEKAAAEEAMAEESVGAGVGRKLLPDRDQWCVAIGKKLTT